MTALCIASWNVREGVASENEPVLVNPGVADDLVDRLNTNQVDIVALQEVDFAERDDSSSILEAIAARTELRHIAPFPFSPSSFFSGRRAGVAIASRFPLNDVFKVVLPNPNLEKKTDSSPFRSYDKGIVGCSINVNGLLSTFVSLHAVPFRRFGVRGSEPRFDMIWDVLSESINRKSAGPMFVCGDFNTTARHVVTSRLKNTVTSAISGRPTHEQLSLDDILYTANFDLAETAIERNFSDHALCIAWLRRKK